MAKNFWKKAAAANAPQTPEEKKKAIDKKYVITILWFIAAGVLLMLYMIALVNGFVTLDLASSVVVLIVAVYFIYSIFQIIAVEKERKEIYSKLPASVRNKKISILSIFLK